MLTAAEPSEKLTLTIERLRELTGYKQPARILAELHRQGFYRARMSPRTGRVILECAHYDAVCAGRAANDATARPRPRVRSVA